MTAKKSVTVAEALIDMRKSGMKEFTIMDVNMYDVVARGASVASMLASEPLQRRIGYARVGYMVMDRKYKKYAFVERRIRGRLCLLTGRDCQLTSRIHDLPTVTTFERYCLDLCEGIEDGPFVDGAGRRKKQRWGGKGQRFKFYRIWNERYGDRNGKNADKVQGQRR